MQKSRVIAPVLFRIVLFSTISLGLSAQAETLLLNNGDRISGEIIELNATTVKIKTIYAGTVVLDTYAIRSFHTNQRQQWQINLKPQQTLIEESKKNGHVNIDGKTVPIQDLALTPEQARWKKSGLLEVSMDVDNDDNRKEKLHINTELNLESKHWRHALKAESKRDKEHKKVTEDTIEINYTLDYLFDAHWLIRADSTYREEGVDITSQYWYLGAGPGYRFWGEGKDKLDIIVAYNRFWFETGPFDLELSAWATALDYEQYWFNEKLQTFADIRIAFPTIDAIDHIANTSSGLRYYFEHNIHVSFKYDYNETRFIPGTVRDSSYVLGAGVNF